MKEKLKKIFRERRWNWISIASYLFATVIPAALIGFLLGFTCVRPWADVRVQTITFILSFIISTVSVIVACIAFRHSRKSQYVASFSNSFNVQISLLERYFNDVSVQQTFLVSGNRQNGELKLITNRNVSSIISVDSSIYKNFCNYFKKNADEVCCSELNARQICCIWCNFCDKLENRPEFENSFKYIYMCIKSINDSSLSYDEKTRYTKIVTDMINSEQMFCYFINQIAICDGYCGDDDTVSVLRDSNFFGDMFNSPIYRHVREKIPHYVVRWFSVPH